jgi:hypothetical protein
MESRINHRKLANIVMTAGAILIGIAVLNWYSAVDTVIRVSSIGFTANGQVIGPPQASASDYLSSLYAPDALLPGYSPALLYFGVFVFAIGLVIRLALTKRPAQV